MAENNPAPREQTAEGNGCLYLMGNRTRGSSWIMRDRDKGAGIPGGRKRKEEVPSPWAKGK